jgi:transcriptional regulator with PAS, ATPase and Fis domain
LAVREFDEVVLLSNYEKAEADAYVSWGKSRTTAKIAATPVRLSDPTEFTAVYKAADEALSGVVARHGKAGSGLQLTLHLSPGTPTMAAIWVILGKTRYPAELIQTSKERGLVTASVPLDIAAEFVDLIPELLRGPDAALEARTAGNLLETPQFGDVVYRCSAMADVMERARRVTTRAVPVLIEGESGTGKELLARAIHEEGPRKAFPFLAVNCGALPPDLVESALFGHKRGAFSGASTNAKGYFRAAEGGTLFLDEIGELPLDAQVKLLRALQERAVTPVGDTAAYPVNVRIIAATNRDLAAECQARRFREDLFYRLAVAVLRLPPLRERKGDLQLLIGTLLDKANQTGAEEEPGYQRKVLSAGAKNLLLNYPWPGNIRELENTLMRATVWIRGTTITERELRQSLLGVTGSDRFNAATVPLGDGFELDAHLNGIERQLIVRALAEVAGNKTKAAKLLGLKSHQTLTNRMGKVGVPE